MSYEYTSALKTDQSFKTTGKFLVMARNFCTCITFVVKARRRLTSLEADGTEMVLKLNARTQ